MPLNLHKFNIEDGKSVYPWLSLFGNCLFVSIPLPSRALYERTYFVYQLMGFFLNCLYQLMEFFLNCLFLIVVVAWAIYGRAHFVFNFFWYLFYAAYMITVGFLFWIVSEIGIPIITGLRLVVIISAQFQWVREMFRKINGVSLVQVVGQTYAWSYSLWTEEWRRWLNGRNLRLGDMIELWALLFIPTAIFTNRSRIGF
jgi:hypothetical protein